MTQNTSAGRKRFVTGPDGNALTLSDLPQQNQRWTVNRKAVVVCAVRGGLLDMSEACQRYDLTVEEFMSWQAAIDEHGLGGLRTTHVQDYRRKSAQSIN